MKRLLSALHRQERGALLIVSALLILIFTSISLIPILDFMGTGINVTKDTGLHTREIYAAEAGVYDSMWKMIMVAPGVPKGQFDPPLQTSLVVDEKSVSTNLTRVGSMTFRISSTATDPNTGHQSMVDTDVAVLGVGGLDLTNFSTKAMTCNASISGFGSDKIVGDLWLPSGDSGTTDINQATLITDPITGWPTADMLELYFSYLVNKSNPQPPSGIDIYLYPEYRGPLYATGEDVYTITTSEIWTALTGTIYIDGDLKVDSKASIKLDGNTIFVTGSFEAYPGSEIEGPGAIIAIGDITFQPGIGDKFLFAMSVEGTFSFLPLTHFTGAICAGSANISMQPNCSFEWTDPGVGNLDLPGLYNHIRGVETWSIK